MASITVLLEKQGSPWALLDRAVDDLLDAVRHRDFSLYEELDGRRAVSREVEGPDASILALRRLLKIDRVGGVGEANLQLSLLEVDAAPAEAEPLILQVEKGGDVDGVLRPR